MLRELFDAISKQAVAAAAPKSLAKDGRREIFHIAGQPEALVVETEPAPRQHLVGTLNEIISLANRFAEAGQEPVVWYDGDQVVLIIEDDKLRLDNVRFPLVHSDIFRRVVALRDRPLWLDQRDFIRLLRIDLAGTLNPAVLLDRVKKLKIDSGQTITSTVNRQKESMGREVTASVTSEGDIPEVVALNSRIYKAHEEVDSFPVSCSVEIDPMSTTPFRLMPLPDEIERVVYNALESIQMRLDKGLKDVPCYYGKP
jgi:hypothetical protein